MVLNSGQAVLGGPVGKRQLADNAHFHQQLDRSIDGGSPNFGQLATDLLRAKALAFGVQQCDDAPARARQPIALVLEYGQRVRPCWQAGLLRVQGQALQSNGDSSGLAPESP